jgi:DNA invertase Pin-like site-specific DNA recombinase
VAHPMIDITSPHGKLIIAVLGALAEFQRSMILSRTADGRAAMLERLADICRSYGVSQLDHFAAVTG